MIATLVLAAAARPHAVAPSPSVAPAASPDAHAPVIVLVASPDPARARTERRILAELEAAGFTVRVVPGRAEDPERKLEALRRIGRRHDAIASIQVSESGGRVELWLDDRITGKSTTRTIEGPRTESEDTDAIVAAGVVELLQASLLEILRPTARGAPEPPTPPDPVRALVGRVERPRIAPGWGLRAGFTLAAATGGYGIMGGPFVAGFAAFGPRRRLVLDADAFATPLQSHLDTRYGSVASGVAALRAHVAWWPFPEARVSPGFGVGGGALLAWARGRANAETVDGKLDAAFAGLPSVALAAAFRTIRSLRIRLDVHVGLPIPDVAIVVDQARRATLGLPLVDVALALEWVPLRGI